MTPAQMARLYAVSFPESRPWREGEITSLASPPGFLVTSASGFALGRAVAGEAELITLVVDPGQRRQGAGRALLAAFETRAATQAETAFLEVAADNAAAHALYIATGWQETGRRKGYYQRSTGPAVDAVLMTKRLG